MNISFYNIKNKQRIFPKFNKDDFMRQGEQQGYINIACSAFNELMKEFGVKTREGNYTLDSSLIDREIYQRLLERFGYNETHCRLRISYAMRLFSYLRDENVVVVSF